MTSCCFVLPVFLKLTMLRPLQEPYQLQFRRFWIAALLCVLSLACNWNGDSRENPTVPVPDLLDVTQIDREPAWSPDGRYIAFTHIAVTSPPDSLYQIWLLDLTSEEQSLLALGSLSSWSPDGTMLAFVLSGDIYTIQVDNGTKTRATHLGSCFYPAWSPDGQWIAYDILPRAPIVPRDSTGIWMVRPDGSERTPLLGPGARMPAWSADGSRLAFSAPIAPQSPYWEIGLFSLSDSSVQYFTRGQSDDFLPRWSPTGALIAWELHHRTTDDLSGVWIMDSSGANATLLAKHGLDPSWSPDGNKIVYSRFNQDSNTQTLWLMNADGTNKEPLTQP